MQQDRPSQDTRGGQRRYEVLGTVASLVATQPTLPVLIHETARQIEQVAAFQYFGIRSFDPHRNRLRLEVWDGEKSPFPDEVSVDSSMCGWVLKTQEPLWIRDAGDESRFGSFLEQVRDFGFRTWAVVPVTIAGRPLGALGVASRTRDAYTRADIRLFERVGQLVAICMEIWQAKEALRIEKEALQAMVEMNRTLSSSMDVRHLFPQAMSVVDKMVPHDFAGLSVYDSDLNAMRTIALGSLKQSRVMDFGAAVPLTDAPAAHAYREGVVKRFGADELAAFNSEFTQRMLGEGIRSLVCLPVKSAHEVLGVLNVGSSRPEGFSELEQSVLQQISDQIALALENARAYGEIEQLRSRLAQEKEYLDGEVSTDLNFENIIGESLLLKQTLSQARTVAPSHATALILGETGTGKELVARAIHRMSGRSDKPFIKMNCAAIPTGLLESELFGHERGAFTGAISQKIGRMELADKGTLFLDEVGDIPLELQPKLLRVLQDQEFERLGSTKTIHVDVRLIAATNRDLAKRVAEGQFRSDLFYRLNVFPVRVPPLRERKEDIPQLVRYFVQKFSRRMDKKIETIPNTTLTALSRWKWPGNVRELENFIERSVILTEGPVLRVPLTELEPDQVQPPSPQETLETVERDHILRVLRECGGVLSGPRGAALRLGVKRTTLQSKMRRLGIQRDEYSGWAIRKENR